MHTRRVTVLLAAGLLAGCSWRASARRPPSVAAAQRIRAPGRRRSASSFRAKGDRGSPSAWARVLAGEWEPGRLGVRLRRVRLRRVRRRRDSAGEWWCEYQPVLARSGTGMTSLVPCKRAARAGRW